MSPGLPRAPGTIDTRSSQLRPFSGSDCTCGIHPGRHLHREIDGRLGQEGRLAVHQNIKLGGRANVQGLTREEADHAVSFSPDGAHFVDVFSRVDLPTVPVRRRAQDGQILKADNLEVIHGVLASRSVEG
jgi:hypothetical protein